MSHEPVRCTFSPRLRTKKSRAAEASSGGWVGMGGRMETPSAFIRLLKCSWPVCGEIPTMSASTLHHQCQFSAILPGPFYFCQRAGGPSFVTGTGCCASPLPIFPLCGATAWYPGPTVESYWLETVFDKTHS